MTVTVSPQLQQAIQQKAAERQVSVDQLVQEAVERYLQGDAEFQDELQAWQEIRDEAAEVVKESTH